MNTLTATEKKAAKHAAAIKWDADEAIAYAVALLTECNCHTEAAALQAAAEQKRQEWEEAYRREGWIA